MDEFEGDIKFLASGNFGMAFQTILKGVEVVLKVRKQYSNTVSLYLHSRPCHTCGCYHVLSNPNPEVFAREQVRSATASKRAKLCTIFAMQEHAAVQTVHSSTSPTRQTRKCVKTILKVSVLQRSSMKQMVRKAR